MPRTRTDNDSNFQGAVIREARLRVGFEMLYPNLQPGVWIPAAELGAMVLFHRFSVEGPAAFDRRPLLDEHFEFRGGWHRGAAPDLRTRVDDTPEPRSATA